MKRDALGNRRQSHTSQAKVNSAEHVDSPVGGQAPDLVREQPLLLVERQIGLDRPDA
jgi:hypothetical protein